MKLSIRTKLLLLILAATILVFGTTIAYLGFVSKNDYYTIGMSDVNKTAEKYALQINDKIENYFTVIRTLAYVNNSITDYNSQNNRDLILENYNNVLKYNKNIDGIWDSWEYTQTNANGIKEQKRVLFAAERVGDKIIKNTEIKGITPEYAEIVNSGNETCLEPYLYSFTRQKQDECLVTSLSVQMKKTNKRIGIVGIDIKLSNVQHLLNNIKLPDGGKVELISQQGNYLYNINSELIGEEFVAKDEVLNHLKTSNFYSRINNIGGTDIYETYSKIKIANSNNFWILLYNLPKYKLEEEAINTIISTLIIGFFGLVVLAIFIALITLPITKPIKNITNSLKMMSLGELKKLQSLNVKQNDELGEMQKAMNLLKESLIEKTEFAEKIGEDELSAEVNLLSENDILGKALVSMRDHLINSKNIEIEYKKEEEKRTWANHGYAFFAEILRKNNENIQDLNNEIIKNLVKYTNSNQGAIFIVDEHNSNEITLSAVYAYDRKKYLEKTITKGEGLIGTCYVEKQSIYLTDIPQEYITITSGLGSSNPTALLLVPIKNDDDVIGVIEIASFTEYEKYKLEFIEKLATTIASTILTVKNNEKTKFLLEQTNQQSEEMRSQEEEMRQNMEELIATQEDVERRTIASQSLTNALNTSQFIIECNTQGEITYISNNFLEYLKVNSKEVLGKHNKMLLYLTNESEKEYEQKWENIISGESEKTISIIKINNNKFVLHQVYMPVKNDSYGVEKIIIISNDFNNFNKL